MPYLIITCSPSPLVSPLPLPLPSLPLSQSQLLPVAEPWMESMPLRFAVVLLLVLQLLVAAAAAAVPVAVLQRWQNSAKGLRTVLAVATG